ncbi:MAG: DUF445 family protein [Chitinivibrionales bacterium]|nr:DUF445 family protein [Chitinivibrionales bacterium]
MNYNIIFLSLIPIISGLIGWLTNYIAVKMIFRPRKPVTILGIRFQGLIPKRKSELARKIGETVEKELISHRDIKKAMQTPAFHDAMVSILGGKIDELFQKLLGTSALTELFLSGDVVRQIKTRLMEELEPFLPSALDMLLKKVESHLDFKKIVQEKIEGFDMSRLENIVYAIASRELKAIEIFGGILGFMIGLVQVGLIVAGKIL